MTQAGPSATKPPTSSLPSLPDPNVIDASGTKVAGNPRPAAIAAVPGLSVELDYATDDLASGRLRAAFDRITAVLVRSADHPRALGLLGQVAVSVDRPAVGLEPLQRAVALDPKFEHRIWLSLCLAKLDRRNDALQQVAAAIQSMPLTANAYFAVGMVWQVLGQNREAACCYANCIALDTTRASAHHRYARALQADGRTGSAIDAYIEAVRCCHTNADYHADLSSALSDLGRFEEASRAARTAVQLDPGCIVAHNNLGHALHSLNRSAEALVCYETAIRACGSYARAQFGYAVALLKSGDFQRGWRQYEWRWNDCQAMRSDLAVPVWTGEPLNGRTILLHAEQGLGDTLQFVRFAPLIASRGARVVLEVPASLVRLLRRVEGVAEVIASGDPLPPVDLHCPMASLPHVVDLRLETIPASPYLHGPADDATRPRRARSCTGFPGVTRRLDLVVGLVWAGDPRQFEPRSNLIDRRRSTTLQVLAPLLDIEGTRFISFQLGDARGQLADLGKPVMDGMEGVTDFADTAARLGDVDLLVSVDTSIVHLAGGLGVPVWMLSRFDGCWRWLERRDDTPWYPSMRIFRQPSPGDWSSVIAEVAAALRAIIGNVGAPSSVL